MSGRTSAALSPVEGCCGNGGVRGVRGRCWGRNNRLEKQILNTTLGEKVETHFFPYQTIIFSLMSELLSELPVFF